MRVILEKAKTAIFLAVVGGVVGGAGGAGRLGANRPILLIGLAIFCFFVDLVVEDDFGEAGGVFVELVKDFVFCLRFWN